jgi:hypothetical protein
MRFGTEDVLVNAIEKVQDACSTNQMMHLSHCFTDDPDHLAVVASFTVCSDEVAKELHAALDAATAEFFQARHIHIR